MRRNKTVIVGGDRDLLQLVSPHVVALLTRKGITEVDRYDPDAIAQRYHLTPGQIVDLKGLMGDTSDNIPGVPGVGEKTALKLLEEYHSVEDIFDHVDQISGEVAPSVWWKTAIWHCCPSNLRPSTATCH